MATQDSTEFLTIFTYHTCRQEANTQPDSQFRELHACSLIGLGEKRALSIFHKPMRYPPRSNSLWHTEGKQKTISLVWQVWASVC